MSLLCSCYKCNHSTPFDRPCEACGFENPVYPDTVENVARAFLEKHAGDETEVTARKAPSPPVTPLQPAIPPPPVVLPPPAPPSPQAAPILPQPAATPPQRPPPLGPTFAVYIHPFLGLCAAALLGYTLQVDDFVERLIYYCAAGIVLLVDLLMLSVEASRIAAYCSGHLLWRLANAFASLPVSIVLVIFGVDEMTLGFGLLGQGWIVLIWAIKSLITGLALTLFGVAIGVYACELLADRALIGSPRGRRQ
jgi:hypothetical protein